MTVSRRAFALGTAALAAVSALPAHAQSNLSAEDRAASLIERMEQEGVVSPANHAGKRDILAGPPPM